MTTSFTQQEILEGAQSIGEIIQSSLTQYKGYYTRQGCLIGRFGTIEFDVIYWAEKFPESAVPTTKTDILERNAGIFPATRASLKRWVTCAKEAMMAADILAVGWHAPMATAEKELLGRWGWQGTKIPLRSLEPYYVAASAEGDCNDRWTRLLAGASVCVVTSFAATAAKQVAKGEERVWPGAGGSIWPASTIWHWVQTGYPPSVAHGRAGWEDSPESWEEAVEGVLTAVLATGALIVIIGCGGLGMIIGARLKAVGKICIVMGGATQVLFGIKGGRWANHPVISTLWNSEWVWPSAQETPKAADAIEGSCYWTPASHMR